MKPLQLKMTAFGPYKFTEIIDFTELKGNRLFVISGATGAGKTTIFDGICFALYGSGSGEDRKDTKMMRSDFATDDTHTSVELLFEIHEQKYRILRQLPHVKKGNKSATGERYEFFEVKERGEIPAVERQIVSEINKKVEEIIGLTQDQFSQIVMLPQGEFRKLLTSQTENKEAILRKIFKTEPYRMISEKLKDKKIVVEAELKKEELARNSFTEQIVASFPKRESSVFELIESSSFNTFQLVEALKEETIFYKEKIQIDGLAYKEAYEKHIRKQAAYHEAKTINERFAELEWKEQKLGSLQEQSEEFAKKQNQLEAAERASMIEPLEGYYRELKQEADDKFLLLNQIRTEATTAEEAMKQAEVTYSLEENKKGDREKSVEAFIQLNALLPLLEEIETKKTEMLKLEKLTADLNDQVTSITNQFSAEQKLCARQKEEIESLEQMVEPLDQTVQQLNTLQMQYSVIQEYTKQNNQLDVYSKEEIAQKSKLEQIKETYALEEQKWMSNQASILASQLVAGEACPVCGSTEHTIINASHPGHAMDENVLKRLKESLNRQESDYVIARTKKETTLEVVQKFALQIEELQIGSLEVNRLSVNIEHLQEKVNSMREGKNKLSDLKNVYKNNVARLDKLGEEKFDLEASYQRQKGLWEQAKAVYASKQTSIPTHIQNLQELQVQITLAAQHKDQLENRWLEVQSELQRTKEFFAKAQLSLEHAIEAEKEITSKLRKAKDQLYDALDKAGFHPMELYIAAKMSEHDRTNLKLQCTEYKQNLHTLMEQIKEMKEQLINKSKIDLAPLEEELVQLRGAYEEAFSRMNSSREYEKVGLQLEEKINSTSVRISMLEQQVGRVTDLYDMLRGQNPAKISFERYVQMEYLEQIVNAANERLKLLSSGQYSLIRSERQETHGKQSGLGLDVYDAYTGQMRDVKTLSGGEKFNASLCLALGMADVIQSFQGSIRIDTMFIDEGFGSLDEESLNKAIDTLIDLQKSGRMIGVISHVAELKAAMPAILEVEKLREGYSKTKFVIK